MRRWALLLSTLGTLAGCAAHTAHTSVGPADSGRPALVLRTSPLMPMSRQPVLITAELVGREEERLYCPRIEWTMPDGTHATEESDCAPWGTAGAEYRRRWTRRVTFGSSGTYAFEIRLEKAGRVLMRQTLTVEVRG